MYIRHFNSSKSKFDFIHSRKHREKSFCNETNIRIQIINHLGKRPTSRNVMFRNQNQLIKPIYFFSKVFIVHICTHFHCLWLNCYQDVSSLYFHCHPLVSTCTLLNILQSYLLCFSIESSNGRSLGTNEK